MKLITKSVSNHVFFLISQTQIELFFSHTALAIITLLFLVAVHNFQLFAKLESHLVVAAPQSIAQTKINTRLRKNCDLSTSITDVPYFILERGIIIGNLYFAPENDLFVCSYL